jgi:phosphate-selective porin OprO/OprP
MLAFSSPNAWPQAPSMEPPVPPAAPSSNAHIPSSVAASDVGTEFERRLRESEATNKKLAERVEQLTNEQQNMTRLLLRLETQATAQPLSDSRRDGQAAELPDPDAPAPSAGDVRDADPDVGSAFDVPDEGAFETAPPFQFENRDGSLLLRISYWSQFETRMWSPQGHDTAKDGFYMPRQRIYFSGHVTKPIDYEFAINRGLNGIDLLQAFINFHFRDELQIRIGRFFTPVLYDQFAVPSLWLPTTERSIFATNLGPSRQIGVMARGTLFDERIDYATGIFNGSRNSFENRNGSFDFAAFLNSRPFHDSSLMWAQNWNVGSSVSVGYQSSPPVPRTFRVGAGSPDANVPGIATLPFMILNPDVIEKGDRLIGSVHMAYYLQSLSLFGEWQYGWGDYASETQRDSKEVPFAGFYVTTGYFLTGEEVDRRTQVKPLRPFVPLHKDEERGPGAWEVVTRVSRIHLGDEFFNAGFADETLWANEATTTELGANWYWNDFTKFYFFWLHADFNKPIQYRAGEKENSASMLWMRCQFYF